ncbi:DUF58 domain-containing protein [Nitrospina watsonii]|uniref:VWFA domain-containing protein n=1 Tax=Nitrospina watsonii TaxID=1323948 RepID=A0ABN8W007_9BACT|nr:DUF58 domain-containing protein [Nitrospina watsonii]CAI2717743.1 VWFA domain-containing protein [Nitrospina watsonii]
MAEDSQSLYNAETLAEISSLSLRAITLVEGLLSGQHRSPHKGSSVEFAEYKAYSPGDDIRHIDWKVVGKTDKYHVKQFEQATNLKCTILLDTSGSMGYQSPLKKQDASPKAEYVRTLVAAFSYLLLKQFDAVGLLTFNRSIATHIPPRSKPSHFQHILHALGNCRFEGETHVSEVVGDIIERLPGRGMLVMISDLLVRDDDVLKTLNLIRSRGLEVLLFHVLHPDEIELPFDGDIVFESLEDDPPVGLNPEDVRDQYKATVQDFISHFQTNCPSLGIDYQFLNTATPLEQALRYYLLRRNSLLKL